MSERFLAVFGYVNVRGSASTTGLPCRCATLRPAIRCCGCAPSLIAAAASRAQVITPTRSEWAWISARQPDQCECAETVRAGTSSGDEEVGGHASTFLELVVSVLRLAQRCHGQANILSRCLTIAEIDVRRSHVGHRV